MKKQIPSRCVYVREAARQSPQHMRYFRCLIATLQAIRCLCRASMKLSTVAPKHLEKQSCTPGLHPPRVRSYHFFSCEGQKNCEKQNEKKRGRRTEA